MSEMIYQIKEEIKHNSQESNTSREFLLDRKCSRATGGAYRRYMDTGLFADVAQLYRATTF